jgi:hypothetical protein
MRRQGDFYSAMRKRLGASTLGHSQDRAAGFRELNPLRLGDSMSGGWAHPAALAVLGVCTIVCAGLAGRFFRWE